jgi:branched-chain amino acid transport system ATP-binding protein
VHVTTADVASAEPPSASTSDAVSALTLEGIAVRFGGIVALSDVSLEVEPGEVLGLIGPNGAGKTTLFDVISGVRTPDRGRVVLAGADVTSLSAVRRARRGLRRTFQRVQTFGWLSVQDNVLSALEWRGGGGGFPADLVSFPARRRRERERRARAREVLARCGLDTVAEDPAGSLPIGLARMLEVARAIADQPTVLLLDEPTSGLDDNEAGRLGELIQSIRSETACAILLVEHDTRFVMHHCDRIVVLDLGRVLAVGTPDEIQANPAVRAAYLGERQRSDQAEAQRGTP